MKFNPAIIEITDKNGETYKTRLIPVTRWNDFHIWPSVSGLRWMAINAERTGFDKCVVRVGRRVLIDETKFFEFIQDQRKEAKARR